MMFNALSNEVGKWGRRNLLGYRPTLLAAPWGANYLFFLENNLALNFIAQYKIVRQNTTDATTIIQCIIANPFIFNALLFKNNVNQIS